MKKTFLFIPIFLLLSFFSVYSQTCIPSVIVFTTQAEVDNFPIDHPGCTEILGNVGITGSDITNLDALTQVTEIGGHLVVEASSLTDISGLFNLTQLGGDLTINTTLSGTSIAFNALDTIDGNAIIQTSASSFSFPVLTNVHGLLSIQLTSPCTRVNSGNCMVVDAGLVS